MGCDIHAFIETFSKQESLTNDSCFVDCYSSEISFGRDYILFGLIAGVRHNAIISPRGIPTNPSMSYTTSNKYFLRVVDLPEDEVSCRNNCVARMKAEEYVKQGSSQYTDDSKNKIIGPDWHTPTWLTLDELIQIRKIYLLETIQYYSNLSGKKIKELVDFIESKEPRLLMRYAFPPHENSKFYATLCAMQALERTSDENDVQSRLVCWFDS